MVKIVWDEPKRVLNLRRHQLDFADAEQCDWDAALIVPSYQGRRGEKRFLATLPFGDDLVSIAFASLGSEAITVISMRRASRQERRAYVETP